MRTTLSKPTSTLEHAVAIATQAHAGQVDKAGEPYIEHPLRVMRAMATEPERIVAVLHDVVEDTPVTLEQLRADGFSDDVLAAVEALTKRPGESRMQSAARAKLNPIALGVKLADNLDNQDLSRIAVPTAKDHARIAEYKAVRAFLESP